MGLTVPLCPVGFLCPGVDSVQQRQVRPDTYNVPHLHYDVSLSFVDGESPHLYLHSPQTQIVLVDGLFECDGVEQILSAASTMETKPYLVITVAQAHSRGSSLHNLMFKHPVRMVTCTPQSEPVNHILPRQLRRQVLELKAVWRLVML